jgi:sterol desaturase/sphingolipid hydroxylase (fatty acid hydroxylase superfamily)
MSDTAQYAWIIDLVYKVVFNATKSLLAFFQRDSYLYWPYVVSTLVIALIAWRVGPARSGLKGLACWREFRRRYLSRAIWWHPSSRVDYRFYIVNAVVIPVLFAPFLAQDATVSAWLERAFGAGEPGSLSPAMDWLSRFVYTVLFFVAYDLGRFIAHSLLHDVPWLWEFHKVHHSAEVLTPMTSFRAHPIDLAVMVWVPALTTGTLTWAFHRFIDPGIGAFALLGLHVLFWVSNLIGNLRHWQVWVSYGQTLNRWLISPAHHQLHHSAEPRDWGCNRGFELAIWDRWYGTLRVPRDQPETFRMGLGDETDGRWTSVGRLYFWPFVLLVRRILGRRPKPVREEA